MSKNNSKANYRGKRNKRFPALNIRDLSLSLKAEQQKTKLGNNARNNMNKNEKKNYQEDMNNTRIAPPKNVFISNKIYEKNKIRKKDLVKSKGYGNRLIDKPSIKVMFFGGLNEIGKNITLFECQDDIFILDCGIAFPSSDMLGVDLVLPDFTYIERNKNKIKGLVITHGHEDHIGGIPYLIKQGINVPIYATALAVGLIKIKLKEHGFVNKADIHTVSAGSRINLGCMNIELIRVNHSIPDAVGIAIHSPAGTIVHTGDFKIDFTPPDGKMINLTRFAELGKSGVLALMADSTNAEKPGYTMTEQKVIDSFEVLFNKAGKKRIIIASFASNVNRVNQMLKIAERFGRKVAFSGRSMLNYMAIAKELGYIDVDDKTIIEIDEIKNYPEEQIVLITTGSQGEPMAALSRMANSDHRKITVGPNDMIIISAKPIPGNEKMVGKVIDELLKKGCKVIYEAMYDVHVSGHACQEELKLMHRLIKPKYFIPVHGEQKHLVKNASIAKTLGMPSQNVFIGDNGSCIELNEMYMKELPSVPSGEVYVDGIGVGDVGNIVLRDRKHLSQDGVIIVVVALSKRSASVVSGPDIVSRGFVYIRESEPLMEVARNRVACVLDDCKAEGVSDWGVIKNRIRDSLSKFFYERTRRSPMILPIIMDV